MVAANYEQSCLRPSEETYKICETPKIEGQERGGEKDRKKHDLFKADFKTGGTQLLTQLKGDWKIHCNCNCNLGTP